MQEEKSKNIAFTIRIPETLKFQLDMIAAKEDRSTNKVIKRILQEYVDKVQK